ncbi:MAG: alpha/beta fold hydrolase [Leeuwenhoekiella sp.]
MTKNHLLYLFLSITSCISAQDFQGDWIGQLNMGAQSLEVAFHIDKTSTDYSGTMDIPQQGLNGGKADSVTVIDSSISMSFPQFGIEYQGKLVSADSITGNLLQGGMAVPLELHRGILKLNRPQEPKPPFNYYCEEITFTNAADGITLAGTLTLPKSSGKYPVVIIVSGSGPQDRHGTMFSHKPYLVLADHLTKNGIGVFRFDERGVGESEGNFEQANINTFMQDVTEAINFLKQRKDIAKNQIGLIGHSIGGIVAPKLAAVNKDVAFLVLLAAPGVPGDELMLSQKAAVEKIMGVSEQQIDAGQKSFGGAYEIANRTDLEIPVMQDSIMAYFKRTFGGLLPESQAQAISKQLTGAEVLSLIQSRPSAYMSQIKIPVLALNGTKDFQVPAEANLEAIKNNLSAAGNTQFKIIPLNGLNHLFQESDTGALSEYATIEQTFSPKALTIISEWINTQIR